MISDVYAMARPEGQGGGGGFVTFLPFILIFLILYLLIIRPQQKKQRAHQAMLDALRKGDKVVTAGGLYGTIIGFKESNSVVILKIADNVKVEVSKSSISGVRKPKERG